jgi:hypothetical protein
MWDTSRGRNQARARVTARQDHEIKYEAKTSPARFFIPSVL